MQNSQAFQFIAIDQIREFRHQPPPDLRREEQEYEAERARKEEVRKARATTFERILMNAPDVLTFPQLRVLLRALVKVDPYTSVEDVADDLPEEFKGRDAEEVLLAALEATTDDKLTGFAVRLALAGHRGIPRENEPDFLAEADAVFPNTAAPVRKAKTPKVTKPTLVLAKKKKARRRSRQLPNRNGAGNGPASFNSPAET